MLDPQQITSSAPLENSISGISIPDYSRQLRENKEWGMNDASLFFEGKGKVHETLNRLTRKLAELQIPYAIVGGLSLFEHGFPRFTEDVDLLVTKESLLRIHEALEGLGYLKLFAQSKNLRDTTTGVKIDFLITGGFPGDGRPGPVSFPDPETVSENHSGKSYASLPTIITLKLASGITGGINRAKDFTDVIELIKSLQLSRDFVTKLHPYVQSKYLEMWDGLRGSAKYVKFIEPKDPNSLAAAMAADGILPEEGRPNVWITTDARLAKKYDMHDYDDFNESL
jgi:hypothetical protein